MADTMTAEQRHRCMSHIRAKDTKPEMIVRRFLWAKGFRFRLHSKKLPGHPDIVLRRYNAIVFVNGCFWHGHDVVDLEGGELANSVCCKIPHSNRQFWLDKINRNRRRDVETVAALKLKGWRVMTIWECELSPKNREATLARLLRFLKPATSYAVDEPSISIAAESETNYNT